jgi:hypothetical protein
VRREQEQTPDLLPTTCEFNFHPNQIALDCLRQSLQPVPQPGFADAAPAVAAKTAAKCGKASRSRIPGGSSAQSLRLSPPPGSHTPSTLVTSSTPDGGQAGGRARGRAGPRRPPPRQLPRPIRRGWRIRQRRSRADPPETRQSRSAEVEVAAGTTRLGCTAVFPGEKGLRPPSPYPAPPARAARAASGPDLAGTGGDPPRGLDSIRFGIHLELYGTGINPEAEEQRLGLGMRASPSSFPGPSFFPATTSFHRLLLGAHGQLPRGCTRGSGVSATGPLRLRIRNVCKRVFFCRCAFGACWRRS